MVPYSLDVVVPAEIGGQPVSDPLALVDFTVPISLTGNPSASIPCGWTPDGLPIGMPTDYGIATLGWGVLAHEWAEMS